MISNPLYDKEFLNELFSKKKRWIYARVTALTQQEKPIEYIEGKITGGTINIDGASSVRRTCSLTLIAQDVNINDFYWGVKNKFKLEIGLKNEINSKYPDIIWFKQGLYVTTSFSTSYSINNYTINISGKDKMCLLNGDLAGALPHTTDFGIEEYYDKEKNITTYTSVPIRRIIQESLQNFGNELPQNIIINDLEDAGLNLLEYRGDVPMYMFRNVTTGNFDNITFNANTPCKIGDKDTTISDDNIIYDNLVNLSEGQQATIVLIGATNYTIAKFEYGSIPGYELTDLVFAGDLICNVGETLTSMLDKIKNMLGEFEYFYNVDGKFVFQKKQTYVDVYWNDIEKGDEIYANAAVNKSTPIWSFSDSQLISNFQNTPNILNLRNDFAIWGKKKTTSGTEIDIHMRYAIDKKPTIYKTLDGQVYSVTKDENKEEQKDWIKTDWRELIYQMAIDYRKNYHNDEFLYKVAAANPQYPNGHTGYEQYYVDMEGFWRQIYNPDPTNQEISKYNQITINEADINYDKREKVFIKNSYRQATAEELRQLFIDNELKKVYGIVNQDGVSVIKPFLNGICNVNLEKKKEDKNAYVEEYYGFDTSTQKMVLLTPSIVNLSKINIYSFYVKNIAQLYVTNKDSQDKPVEVPIYTIDGEPIFLKNYGLGNSANDNRYTSIVGKTLEDYIRSGEPLYIRSDTYEEYDKLPDVVKGLYKNQNHFIEETSYYSYDIEGKPLQNTAGTEYVGITKEKIQYYLAYYEFNNDGWAKIVTDQPEQLIFWFDFLDAEGSDLEKYSVHAVGTRSKATSDKDVKCIYYREIPQTIFQVGEETYEHQPGYTYVNLRPEMKNLFIISSKGKSAQEALEDMLYKYSYCIESSNITALPVYHLEPNTRVLIKDQKSGINGEYTVSKITLPLAYNGTMSLTATKVISNIT